MNTYKLDQHLKELCNQEERYLNLYSTWILNKKTCSDLLKNVVVHYPHFSMHDASHADAVLSKMEMLLGERVKNLSPTDTWLLLHAAFAHDLGMVVEWSSIETKWSEKEFQDNLSYLETLPDEDLQKAIWFVRETHDLTKEQVWPLEASRYVRLINAALFRGKHAQISKDYIEFTAPELGLDLGHNHLIQPRLVKLLGQICKLHTEPLEQVLKLDYQTNGFDSDYAHPRFVAMMLRLGDLLDIDNGRFNAGAEAVSGGLPATSEPHREKHEATTHLLVMPKEIRFRSNCPDASAYLEARKFVSWLEQEIDFLTKNWAKIVPENLGGYAPRFDEKELLINGVPDIEGVADLKFEISQDKAFQMIEGANIYRDSLVFLREVIQNAADASKLQLWSDLCSDTYLAWMGAMDEERLHTLQPYEIKPEIYQNYPIQISLSTIDTDRVQIKVTDRGTGISVESFKRMCNVGESNESSPVLRDILQKMPNWLRPTAGFGIGLQSIFLVTDQFTIDTSTGQEAFHAIVYSKRKGGYLQLQRINRPMPRGTTITIEAKKYDDLVDDDLTYEISELYTNIAFDPLHDESRIFEMRILGNIRQLREHSMFPLHVRCQEESVYYKEKVTTFPLIRITGWDLWKDRYWYKLEEDGRKFSLWDKKEAVLVKFTSNRTRFTNTSSIYFKGMPMELPINLFGYRLSSYIDIYGMETKKALTLDRLEFTSEGRKKILELQRHYISVFCNIILQKLQEENFELGKSFEPYSFWLNCDKQQRMQIPPEIIQQISDDVKIFEKTENNDYQTHQKPVRELIPQMEHMPWIDPSRLSIFRIRNNVSADKTISSVLNNAKGIEYNSFMVDTELFSCLSDSYYIGSLNIPDENQPLVYYTWQHDPTPIKVSLSTRKKVLLSLRQPLMEIRYSGALSTRHATFAIDEYKVLAVKSLPHQILHPSSLKSAWMISPFVKKDEKNRVEFGWSKETFAALVMASEMFQRVVDWVVRFSILDPPPSRDEIIEAYQKLMYEYCEAAEEEDKKPVEKSDI